MDYEKFESSKAISKTQNVCVFLTVLNDGSTMGMSQFNRQKAMISVHAKTSILENALTDGSLTT